MNYPTLQWILENGQNLVARNIYSVPTSAENKFLPYFTIEIFSEYQGIEELVLTSLAVLPGNCPTWAISSFESTPQLERHYCSQMVIVRISALQRNLENRSKTLVVEERFDLTKLQVYRVAGTLSGFVFPINTVLLLIGEEYYSSSKQSTLSLLTSSFDQSNPSEQANYLTMTVQNTRSHHLTSCEEIKQLQNKATTIHEKLQQSEISHRQMWLQDSPLRQQRQSHEQQIRLLYADTKRKELEALRRAKERAKQEQKTYLDKIGQSQQRYHEFEDQIKQHQGYISSMKQEMKTKAERLMKLKFVIEGKQIKFLYELAELFPIEVRKNECLIRDIEIPNDLSAPAKDDEAIASGLGYVVHLLLLCSKYLEIPLRYQLLYMGSRSLVRDHIRDSSKDPVATYPLFKRGVEKERFEKAVLWLKGNVEFLLRCRNLEYDNSKHFLLNLQQLFDCDSCARTKI